MALSQRDLEALVRVRAEIQRGEVPVEVLPYLEWVMALAGEPIPEPEIGTFWLDPDRGALYSRVDDGEYPWVCTDATRYRWDEFGLEARRRLVRLVREEF